MTRVSVIVPARDAERTLGRALEALRRQRSDEPCEVLVVDDGSADGTAEVASRAPAVRVLRQDRLGPAAARNHGVREARGELLAFTDADCFAEPGWLGAGLRALGGADLVQGAVRPDPATPMGPFDRSLWVEREAGLYEAANLFVRRELFERVGGFEEWLRPRRGKAMAEDVLFGWRVRRAGGRSAFCPDALVHHAVFPRGAAGYVCERRRVAEFPAIAARVPELRGTFLCARVFLSPRSASFDAAVAGVAVALAARSRLPALAAVPYGAALARRALPWRRRAPLVAAVQLAADAVTLASLLEGSARARTPVL